MSAQGRDTKPSQGFGPRRRFGQNFLVDPGAVERIVDALAPEPGQPVLEIGPGRGALTDALIERSGRIAAVEIDRDLADALAARLPEQQLMLWRDDVLRVALDEVLRGLGAAPGATLSVVGNLPYNISKPVALKLVTERRSVARAVLMFQREVARRVSAPPGDKDYGPLAVLVGLAWKVERLFDLKPGAFRPRPAVMSTVTRWVPLPSWRWLDRHEPALRECLRACFARRRRTLRGNLRAALGGEDAARRLLEQAQLDGDERPEVIPREGYVRLAEHWPSASPEASPS